MYAKMIRKLLGEIKSTDKLSVYEIENKTKDLLHSKCYRISIQFKTDTDNIETNRFGLLKECRCPHGKTEKSMCSNCDNFVIHEFELKHGKTLIPSTSTSVGYCAKQKYKK